MEDYQRILLQDGFVDLKRRTVVRDTLSTHLTPNEHRLLSWLAQRPGETVTQAQILTEVWGYGRKVQSRTVYTTVQRIRKKIERDPTAPVHLVSVYGSGYLLEPAATTPPPSVEPPPVAAVALDLPAETTSFRGRAGVLAALAEAPERVVTLRGPGGIGKTRTALHFARKSGGRVLWCELDEARSPEDVLRVVAVTAGLVPLPTRNAAHRAERIGRSLRTHGPCLVVLDNLEPLGDAVAPLVDRWRELAPEARWLLTSRAPSGADGERIIDLLALSAGHCLSLFVDRSRQVRWNFALSPALREPLGEVLAVQFDGLPLAIELVAGWMGIMRPEQLLGRVQDRFRLLRDRQRQAIPRHQVLWETIRWSWELLSAEDQRALARCAVFAGGFSLEAAEDVLAAPGAWVPEQLQRLQDQALLQVVDQPGQSLRFRLLETVRAFALERLQSEPAAAAEARMRHRARFVREGRDLYGALFQEQHVRVLRQLARERANLEAALDDALAAEAWADTAALGEVLDELLRQQGDVDAGARLLERLRANLPTPPLWLRLSWVLHHLIRFGSFEDDEYLARLLEGIPPGSVAQARALHRIGTVYSKAGQLPQAQESFLLAISIFDAHKHQRLAGIARANLGIVLRMLGEVARAEEVTRRAIADLRACQDWNEAGGAMYGLAQILQHQDRRGEIPEIAEQVIDIATRHQHQRLLAYGLMLRAGCEGWSGQMEQARRTAERLGALASRIGMAHVSVSVQVQLARFLIAEARYEEAIQALNRLLEDNRDSAPYTRLHLEQLLSEACARSGRFAEALRAVNRARELIIAADVRSWRVIVETNAIRLHAELGDFAQADAARKAALQALPFSGQPTFRAELDCARAFLLQKKSHAVREQDPEQAARLDTQRHAILDALDGQVAAERIAALRA